MARIREKKLNVNDYPEEFRDWLELLFFNLDQFKRDVNTAFNRRLNFRENSDTFIRTVEDLTLTDVSNEEVTVVPDTQGLPCDVLATVIKEDETRVTVPTEWKINDDGTLTITNLETTRLTSDDRFSLQLTIFGR